MALLVHFCGFGNESTTWGVGKSSSCPVRVLKPGYCVCISGYARTEQQPGGLEWKITFQRFSRQQWPLVTHQA